MITIPMNTIDVATERTLWTPATTVLGKRKFRVRGGLVSASVAGSYDFRDGTSGTILFTLVLAAGVPVFFDFAEGLQSSTANHVLTCTGPALSALSGTIWGNEFEAVSSAPGAF